MQSKTKIVTSLGELPQIRTEEVFLDFETTSGNKDLDSLNPWHHCEALGIAICDSNKGSTAYYVPLRHVYENPMYPNLPIEQVREWLIDTLRTTKIWTNHNVKYDAHVLKNSMQIDVRDFGITLYDTVVQCKLINSDLLSYSLDNVLKKFLDLDITQYEHAFNSFLFGTLNRRTNLDYGVIPIDTLGVYACVDVLSVRALKQYILTNLPEASQLVSSNEIKLTSVLFDMEQRGMHIDPQQVTITQCNAKLRMFGILLELEAILGDSGFRPHVNDDCYELLCGRYGLPVLKWTNEDDKRKPKNPSFDKDALKLYKVHERTDAELRTVIEYIEEYRKLSTFESLFLTTFLNEHINGVLHPSYNQCVRTGRLSCSSPNAQQLNELAKSLIVTPNESINIVDMDLSQIEFRLIGMVLRNSEIIRAYKKDAMTDYHQLIADLAGTQRKAAKNLNFAVAFGSGRKKTTQMLRGSLEDTTDVAAKADRLYDEYHRMLPELRDTSKFAESIARTHGYINNMYGRKRVLGVEFAYRAFNTYIQSTAADIAKSISIRLHERLKSRFNLIAVVHDSWIGYVEKSDTENVCKELTEIVESEVPPPPKEFLIPIRCSISVSDKNWGDCK